MFPEERFKEGQDALPQRSVTEVCAVYRTLYEAVVKMDGTLSGSAFSGLYAI